MEPLIRLLTRFLTCVLHVITSYLSILNCYTNNIGNRIDRIFLILEGGGGGVGGLGEELKAQFHSN